MAALGMAVVLAACGDPLADRVGPTRETVPMPDPPAHAFTEEDADQDVDGRR